VQPRVQRLWCGRAAMDGAAALHSFICVGACSH
jgi:hypothetical protein